MRRFSAMVDKYAMSIGERAVIMVMMNRRLIFSILFFVFMLPLAAASAKTVDQNALILELQREIEDLTRQVQTLQQQLSATQSEFGVAPVAMGSEAPSASVATTTPAIAPPELTRALSRGASGDDVRKLQEFLAQDKEIYPAGLITGFFGPLTEAALKKWQSKHDIEALGVAGPKTIAKLKERGREAAQGLLEQGAGVSGAAPSSGIPLTSGSQQFLGTTSATTTPAALTIAIVASTTATTTAHTATTTSPAILCAKDARYCATKEACAAANFSWYTVSCHRDPPPAYSCASSYNYCINPAECASQGWYSCRSSCYPSLDACQGQAYVPPAQAAAIPAVPATPAQPVAQTGTTTVSATPAASAQQATTPPTSSSGWQNIRVTNAVNASYWPSVAWTGTRYGVVWADSREYTTSYGLRLYFTLLDENGQKVTADVKIGASSDGRVLNPQVIWNGSHFAVVYDQYLSDTAENCKVYLTFVSSDGQKMGSDIAIADGCQVRPRITWNGNGYGVIWRSAYPYRVIFAGLDATGRKTTPDRILTSVTSLPTDLFWVDGKYHLWWVQRNDSGPNWTIPFISYLDASGNKLGGDIKVPLPSVSATELSLWKTVWDGAHYGTFLQGYVNGIRQQFFMGMDAAGTKIVDGVQITNNTTADGGLLSGTATWGGDAYGVVFNVSDSHLYLAEIRPDGSIKTAVKQIDTAANHQARNPAFVWTGSRYAAVWDDSRHILDDNSGNVEIYFAQSAPSTVTASTPATPSTSISSTATITAVAADTTPPVISAIQATNIIATSTVITWTTNEASDSQVEYGVSTSYGSQTALDGTRVTSHSVVLSGLAASTAYHYRVKSRDAAGNLATSADQTFATASPSSGETPVLAPPTEYFIDKVANGPDAQPPKVGYAVRFNYTANSSFQSFNIYVKKPSDANFVKYNQTNAYWSYLSDNMEVGEHRFYVTVVNTAGVEGPPTQTKSVSIYASPTISSPMDGAAVSGPLQINLINNATGIPGQHFAVYVFWSGGFWSTDSANVSIPYGGPALSAANNPYRIAVHSYDWNAAPSRFANTVLRYFNVSTATTTSTTAATAFLANILQALSEALATLTRLLQGNQ